MPAKDVNSIDLLGHSQLSSHVEQVVYMAAAISRHLAFLAFQLALASADSTCKHVNNLDVKAKARDPS